MYLPPLTVHYMNGHTVQFFRTLLYSFFIASLVPSLHAHRLFPLPPAQNDASTQDPSFLITTDTRYRTSLLPDLLDIDDQVLGLATVQH